MLRRVRSEVKERTLVEKMRQGSEKMSLGIARSASRGPRGESENATWVRNMDPADVEFLNQRWSNPREKLQFGLRHELFQPPSFKLPFGYHDAPRHTQSHVVA